MRLKVAVNNISKVPKVLEQIDKAAQKVLFKVGGFVRRTARNSIRGGEREKYRYSKPDSPPKGKTGILRKSIRFAVRRDKNDVIIGPRITNTKDPKNIANLHEFGGTFHRRAKRIPIPKDEVRRGPWPEGQEPYPNENDPNLMMVLAGSRRSYAPRPYMGPALDKTIKSGKFPSLFSDTVSK